MVNTRIEKQILHKLENVEDKFGRTQDFFALVLNNKLLKFVLYNPMSDLNFY